MNFSHTQISNYLGCPRRYRYRYLDGWEEKLNRAAVVFGRVFEQALGTHFSGSSSAEAFRQLWAEQQDRELEYATGDSWEKYLEDGLALLEQFRTDARVDVENPARNLALKCQRRIGGRDHYIAYLDAIGSLDGIAPTILDWKTTTSAYPSAPDGIVSLDQQLIAYSWITGIPSVALIVFVRKKKPEIQYLRAAISESQRADYGRLVESTVASIRQARFVPQPGIRFPQNGCLSCGCVGLCLEHEELVAAKLKRESNLVWIDELAA